jgi:hypothetical protein
VAGQGFEPWKASADGFTVRCHSGGLRQVIDATSRALRVPFMESTSGHLRLTATSGNRSSAALSLCWVAVFAYDAVRLDHEAWFA